MKYNIVREHGNPTSATVFHRGRIYVAATDHPNFDAIIDALEQGAKPREVVDLFDTASVIARGFKAARKVVDAFVDGYKGAHEENKALRDISKRLVVKNKQLVFDGEPVHGALADTIVRYQAEGNEDFVPLIRFMAKVMENPNAHSREHLYSWMKNRSFVIHEDGDIIAYKGVRSIGEKFHSTTAGRADVNGRPINGLIPQVPGDVVSMPRNEVTFDPHKGCAAGLHVGTWGFASGYGDAMIEVKVNPKDVVSVPTDSDWQKMRVCRYEFMRQVKHADSRLLRPEKAAAL